MSGNQRIGPAAGSLGSREEDHLRLTLEPFISKVQRRDVEITGCWREPSPFAVRSVFPIEVLRVSLRGGEELALFVSQLGSEQADHPDKQHREREPRLYHDLLGDDDLPVPRYYGSRLNGTTQRLEVFLEYIGDWSLKYQGLDTWFPAARWLARFHAHFARRARDLLACDYLLRLDVSYFRSWAERALAVVAEQAEDLAEQLGVVVDGYEAAAETLSRQPVTLVHNDLSPKNVVADRSRHPVKIYFVDWEMAGVGCGLLDLVHLKHGLDPTDDGAMCAAYCGELEGTGLLPSDQSELRRLFTACELHQTIYRLASSRMWRLPVGRLADWVAEARNLTADLLRKDGP